MPLREGDFVLVRYTIWALEGGGKRLVDTTDEELARRENAYEEGKRYGEYPVIVGRSRLLPGIDEALRDMEVGEKKRIRLPPEKGFGERDEKLVIRVPKSRLIRAGIPPRPGEIVRVNNTPGVIVRVTDRFAFIDFNHPLAGKELEVELEVVRKVDDDKEKAEVLVRRDLGLEPISVEIDEGTLRIMLPATIIQLRDLEARLDLLLKDLAFYLQPKRIQLIIDIEVPQQEERGEAAVTEAGGEAEKEKAGGEPGKAVSGPA